MDGGRVVGAIILVLGLPGCVGLFCTDWSMLWGLIGQCLCGVLSLYVFGDVVGFNRSPNNPSCWVSEFVFGYGCVFEVFNVDI